jgi:predicted nuclease of predicted toxin-antitoxin system
MRIKLDHNLSPYLTEILNELGHDAMAAAEEGLSKASDAVLLYQASVEQRVLFTLDKGFADVDAHPRDTHAGIVVFEQKRNESIAVVERRLIAFARSRKQKKIEGRTVVVEKTRIRFPRGKRKKNLPDEIRGFQI